MEKKQTLLLTVIAVATLLVAVVGATFAYFTAQGGDSASRTINVVTSSTSSSTFEIAGVLSINATQENFGSDDLKNLESATTGTVTFIPSDASDAVKDYCYTVTLTISDNKFEYSATDPKHPELLFNISRGGTEITEGITGIDYKTIASDVTTSGSSISGFDITTVHDGNYQIGTAPYKITATGPGQTATENWSASITLVNLNANQNYNTNKTFAGTLQFAAAACA